MKQAPCCARLTARLYIEQKDLQVLAKRAARYSTGDPRWPALIAKQKSNITQAKQNIVDHDAFHAEQGVSPLVALG